MVFLPGRDLAVLTNENSILSNEILLLSNVISVLTNVTRYLSYETRGESFLASSSFRETPSSSFHVAGPLTLDLKTKSAAAEELENRMSSVVVSETTFPSVKLVDSVIVNFPA